jgi:hypothetical protein
MLLRQAFIFEPSEWVARTPPMAHLFWPWPGEASFSATRVLSFRSASAMASGVPMLPAPIMMTS